METEVRKDERYYYWKKGENPKLSANFYGAEFTCSCKHENCIEQKIAIKLIDDLQWARHVVKSTIDVTSGFRCNKHQNDLRAQGVNTVIAKKSSHEEGEAADVRCPSMLQREFYNVLYKRFNSLGYSRTFTHVDIRPLKADGTKRLWNY